MNDGKQTIQQAHMCKYIETKADTWPVWISDKKLSHILNLSTWSRHQEKKSDTCTCWNKWFIVCNEARRDEKPVYGHIHHIQHSHIISVMLNNSSDGSQHNYLEAAGGKESTPVTWFSVSLQSHTLMLMSLSTAQLQLPQKHIKATFFFPQPQNRNHIVL